MHEVSVVNGIIEAALAELGGRDVAKVMDITIVIGDMTTLGEEQMAFAYEILTKDTILEGSDVLFEREPVTVRCGCGFEGPADTMRNEFYDHVVPIISCPECGGKVEILTGRTCRIKTMTIEEE